MILGRFNISGIIFWHTKQMNVPSKVVIIGNTFSTKNRNVIDKYNSEYSFKGDKNEFRVSIQIKFKLSILKEMRARKSIYQ